MAKLWYQYSFRFQKTASDLEDEEREVYDAETGERLGRIFRGWSRNGGEGWMYDSGYPFTNHSMTEAARCLMRYKQIGKR